MHITIYNRRLLTHCCTDMIRTIQGGIDEDGNIKKGIEEDLQKFLTIVQKRALSYTEALAVIVYELRVKNIYFRILPLIDYMHKHEEVFTGEWAQWTKEAARTEALYFLANKRYFNLLTPHAMDILNAFNTQHEPPKRFFADEVRKQPRNSALARQVTAPSTIIAEDAITAHKEFKVKTHWELLRAKMNDKPSLPVRMKLMQLEVSYWINEGKNIDRTILNDLDVYAQQKYRMLKNKHEPVNVWLKIVIKAMKKAQEESYALFSALKLKDKERVQLEKGMVRGAVALFLSPIGANNFIDPVLLIFKDLSDSMLTESALRNASTSSGSGNSEKSRRGTSMKLGPGARNRDNDSEESDDESNSSLQVKGQLQPFVQRVLKTEPTENPLKAITKHLEKNPPSAALDLMQEYVDYKINGQAKTFSELFQMDTNLWDGETPLDVIRSKRREIMEKYKSETDNELWEKHFSPDEYKKLYSKVRNELRSEFENRIDEIFDLFSEQYVSAQGLHDIAAFINRQTFDDNKSGFNAIDMGNYDALTNKIANVIKLNAFVTFGVYYDPYWGGKTTNTSTHLSVVNSPDFSATEDGYFSIKRNKKTDRLNLEIMKCYRLTGHTLADVDPLVFAQYKSIHDANTHWLNKRYTEQQSSRLSFVRHMIEEYFTTPLDVCILKAIQHRQVLRGEDPTELSTQHMRSTENHIALNSPRRIVEHISSAPNVIDSLHTWQSESELREQAKKLLEPFIHAAQSDNAAVQIQQTFYYESLAEPMQLVRKTKLNMKIQEIKAHSSPSSSDVGSPLKPKGHSVHGVSSHSTALIKEVRLHPLFSPDDNNNNNNNNNNNKNNKDNNTNQIFI